VRSKTLDRAKQKKNKTKVNKNKKTNLNDIKEKTPSIMVHIRDERRGDVTLLI
jgi:3-methyladenine DNA glycosylase AlkC